MKLTLDQAWTRCLPMWREIVAELKNRPNGDVIDLKHEYFEKHDPDANMYGECYFCEYVFRHGGGCEVCPGALIDPQFNCYADEYHWFAKPVAFLHKIEELYKKYLTKKRRRK